MFVFCDDKIAPEVTAREINVGEHPIPGGECGNWLVVKCGGNAFLMDGRRKSEVGSQKSELVGREFRLGEAIS